MQNGLKGLLQKKMDRKDFLKHVGLGVAALTGISAALKAVTPQQASGGYGSMAYGGVKKDNK